MSDYGQDPSAGSSFRGNLLRNCFTLWRVSGWFGELLREAADASNRSCFSVWTIKSTASEAWFGTWVLDTSSN